MTRRRDRRGDPRAVQWRDQTAGYAMHLAGVDDIKPWHWSDDALCAEVDTDIFFPEKGGSARDPKAICARCPVTAECLDYALDMESRPGHEAAYGIYGGLSAPERRRLQQRKQAAA